MLTQLEKDLLGFKFIYPVKGRTYDPFELAFVYQLYNKLNPNNKKTDTGCSGCRREIINSVAAHYNLLVKKIQEENYGNI